MSLLPAFFTDSLDDVVFEGRNQSYGAYQLRQDYQQHLASAGGISLALCLLLLLSWAGWKQLHPAAVPVASTSRPLEPMDIKPGIVIEHPKVAVQPPARARAAATHVLPVAPTEVAKDDVPQPHITPATLPTELVDGPVGLATPNATDAATSVGDTKDGSSTVNGPATAPASSEPFVYVEKMPEFMGGQEALLRYLRTHLRYPGTALAAGMGGRVFMSFVVGADGTISDVTILKGLGYGLDEEAQRVVRQMPAWTPGYQSKHPVPVRFTLPITFSIQ
jgi:protein TonB